jgi:hypothetical protein
MRYTFLLVFFLYHFNAAASNDIDSNNGISEKVKLLNSVEIKNELKAIHLIIEAFRLSIIQKDKPRFEKLFHTNNIPWIGVFSDDSLAFIREKNAEANKLSSSNYLDFINWIVSNKSLIEEKFWNINIQTEQNIASVHFDYSFHVGNFKHNWGQEAWHLIKTGKGWKINSVIYSITVNPLPSEAASD